MHSLTQEEPLIGLISHVTLNCCCVTKYATVSSSIVLKFIGVRQDRMIVCCRAPGFPYIIHQTFLSNLRCH